jgi:hypothetical protein
MAYNLTREQIFSISRLKEMYESNNRLLSNVSQITNQNFNSDNITSLVNNLISTNNEINRNIMSLINLNANNRQHNYNNNNNNNRQHNYSNRQNYHSNRQNYLSNPTISNLFYTFFDPIEIFPTSSQIETATRVVRFGDIIRPLNSECPISLENFNDNDQVLIIRHCNHVFSNTGLTSWFRSSCRCPVCRYDIRNHSSDHPANVSNLSDNVDISSNVLSSSLTSVERNLNSLLSNYLLSNLADIRNVQDTSGNILSINNNNNNNNIPDISGNLLHFFFTPQ